MNNDISSDELMRAAFGDLDVSGYAENNTVNAQPTYNNNQYTNQQNPYGGRQTQPTYNNNQYSNQQNTYGGRQTQPAYNNNQYVNQQNPYGGRQTQPAYNNNQYSNQQNPYGGRQTQPAYNNNQYVNQQNTYGGRQAQPAYNNNQYVNQQNPYGGRQTQPAYNNQYSNKSLSNNTDNSTSGTKSIYIIEFLKSLASKDKVGIDIWLALNFLILVGPFIGLGIASGSAGAFFFLTFLGISFFGLSMTIALSPVGEAILRLQCGCKKIKDSNINQRLLPLFNDVYQKARATNPNISDNVKLFISNDECPNAFATGRKTVCVTRGLLQLSDEEIKGVLAHEFGHLSHKDTDAILIASVGNMFTNIIYFLIQAFIFLITLPIAIMTDGGDIFQRLLNIIVAALFWVWRKIGILLCLHSSRKDEFQADNFAVDLGYHRQLANALTTLSGGDYAAPKGLFASLLSTHPETPDRISSMENHARAIANVSGYRY